MNDTTKKYVQPVTFYCWYDQIASPVDMDSSGSYKIWGGAYPAI